MASKKVWRRPLVVRLSWETCRITIVAATRSDTSAATRSDSSAGYQVRQLSWLPGPTAQQLPSDSSAATRSDSSAATRSNTSAATRSDSSAATRSNSSAATRSDSSAATRCNPHQQDKSPWRTEWGGTSLPKTHTECWLQLGWRNRKNFRHTQRRLEARHVRGSNCSATWMM